MSPYIKCIPKVVRELTKPVLDDIGYALNNHVEDLIPAFFASCVKYLVMADEDLLLAVFPLLLCAVLYIFFAYNAILAAMLTTTVAFGYYHLAGSVVTTRRELEIAVHNQNLYDEQHRQSW